MRRIWRAVILRNPIQNAGIVIMLVAIFVPLAPFHRRGPYALYPPLPIWFAAVAVGVLVWLAGAWQAWKEWKKVDDLNSHG